MNVRGARPGAHDGPPLSLGFLSSLPLFLSYELGLGASSARAPAERLVAHALEPAGERLQWARVAALVLFTTLAVLHARRAVPSGLGRALLGDGAVGMLAGFLLGPVLFALQGWLAPGSLEAAVPSPRSLPACLRLVGAAPWEELLFRAGLYGGLFLLTRRTLSFLGLDASLALLPAELVALLGSALAFAWFHLEAAQRLIGSSGEPYQPGVFVFRLSAGILLGALFRWRGLGVASWAHAVFNLGVALGIRG